MQSPHEAHSSWGPLERRWKNYCPPPAEAAEKRCAFRPITELINPGSDYRQTVSLFSDETPDQAPE
jgi:hypothetical protein